MNKELKSIKDHLYIMIADIYNFKKYNDYEYLCINIKSSDTGLFDASIASDLIIYKIIRK